MPFIHEFNLDFRILQCGTISGGRWNIFLRINGSFTGIRIICLSIYGEKDKINLTTCKLKSPNNGVDPVLMAGRSGS
jgi:hypothetical protein